MLCRWACKQQMVRCHAASLAGAQNFWLASCVKVVLCMADSPLSRCQSDMGTELLTGQLCQGGLVHGRWSIVTLPIWHGHRTSDWPVVWRWSFISFVLFLFLLYSDCLFCSPLDPWIWTASAWTAVDSSVVMHICRQWERVPHQTLGPKCTSEF